MEFENKGLKHNVLKPREETKTSINEAEDDDEFLDEDSIDSDPGISDSKKLPSPVKGKVGFEKKKTIA